MSDHGVRGRGHVALSRHKLGSWNTLLDFLPKETKRNDDGGSSSSSNEQKDDGKLFWVLFLRGIVKWNIK